MILMLFLSFSCGGDDKAATESIRSLVDREMAALESGNLTELSQVWSQDKEILLFDVPPPGRFQGWNKIARVYKSYFESLTEMKLTVGELQIRVEGDIAYATYDWTMSARMGKLDVVDRGQATSIYRLESEGWRMVHAHFSPVPPALALEGGEPGDAPGQESGTADGSGGD